MKMKPSSSPHFQANYKFSLIISSNIRNFISLFLSCACIFLLLPENKWSILAQAFSFCKITIPFASLLLLHITTEYLLSTGKIHVFPLLVRYNVEEELMKIIFHAYSTETIKMKWMKCFLLKLKPAQMFRREIFFSPLRKISWPPICLDNHLSDFPGSKLLEMVNSTCWLGPYSPINHLEKNWSNLRWGAQTLWCSLSPPITHSPNCLPIGFWMKEKGRPRKQSEVGSWYLWRRPSAVFSSFFFSWRTVLCSRTLPKSIFWTLWIRLWSRLVAAHRVY